MPVCAKYRVSVMEEPSPVGERTVAGNGAARAERGDGGGGRAVERAGVGPLVARVQGLVVGDGVRGEQLTAFQRLKLVRLSGEGRTRARQRAGACKHGSSSGWNGDPSPAAEMRAPHKTMMTGR